MDKKGKKYLCGENFTVEELRKLSYDEQEELCGEIREKLKEVVLRNGGHLASNLGVTELTVGMYNVFDPFEDKIVWDVGHQSYVHKILTGREAQFETLRTENGLSGFPKRSESEADVFNTGHSSTSISAATGFARAAEITGKKYRSVAVIGDGAMTGGQAFEALNDAAGHSDKIVVILNDNGMSISKNVGGISRYLGRIRTTKSYIKTKKGIKKALSAIPKIGPRIVKRIQKLKMSFKMLIIPGEIFEMMGCMYIGPVDGHNIKQITEALRKTENADRPCVVHFITEKGRGYKPAEENPEKYHGVAERQTEEKTTEKCKNEPYSVGFAQTLCEMAENDGKIAAITAAMPSGTKLEMFREKYPERFYDVGIAEQHAVTLAAALSFGGAKPYLVLYSTFMQRAFDQLLHDAALQQAKVVIGLDRGGAAGKDGETHQGIYDIALAKTLPCGTVFAPSSVSELKKAVNFTEKLFDGEIPAGPFIIRYPAKNIFTEREDIEDIEYGKGCVLRNNPHAGAAVICLGAAVNAALEAAEKLSEEGIEISVFNARFAKPLDADGILKICENAKLIVTVEDGIKAGGFGEGVCALLSGAEAGGKNFLTGRRIICLGYPPEPVTQASVKAIYEKYGLDSDGIVKTIKAGLEKAENED